VHRHGCSGSGGVADSRFSPSQPSRAQEAGTSGGPPATPEPRYAYYTHEEPVARRGWLHRGMELLRSPFQGRGSEDSGSQAPRPGESAYFALVPLSDQRLRPRRFRLAVTLLSVLATALIVATYLLVPRGTSVGALRVAVESMTWSAEGQTYELTMRMSLPVYNPNYLAVTLDGDLQVLFYDSEAGSTELRGVRVPPRSHPFTVETTVNAGRLDPRYVTTVLNQCSMFPHDLILLVRGKASLTTKFGETAALPEIDTYTLVHCAEEG